MDTAGGGRPGVRRCGAFVHHGQHGKGQTTGKGPARQRAGRRGASCSAAARELRDELILTRVAVERVHPLLVFRRADLRGVAVQVRPGTYPAGVNTPAASASLPDSAST